MDAHIGWPGASGDSTIWQSRPLYEHLDTDRSFLPPEHFLVGDGGYQLSQSVITPFSIAVAATSPEAAIFNFIQSKARRCVEQTFGVLKKTWRVLDTRTEESKANKVVLTWSACILHNMIIRYRQGLQDADKQEEAAALAVEHQRLLDEVDLSPDGDMGGVERLAVVPADGVRGTVSSGGGGSSSAGGISSSRAGGGGSSSSSSARAAPRMRNGKPSEAHLQRLAVAKRQAVVAQVYQHRTAKKARVVDVPNPYEDSGGIPVANQAALLAHCSQTESV